MGNISKLLILMFLLGCAIHSSSQTSRLGHIDFGALIQIMPERVTAEKEFSEYQTELEEVLAEMEQNYTNKLMELEQFNENTSEVKRNAKLTELQSMQKRMDNFQASAKQQARQKYQELLKPIFQKANKAIEEVAKQQNLIYVFDSGTELLTYKSNKSIDIFPMVKKHLGIN